MEETKKSNKFGFLFAVLKILGIIVAAIAVVLIGLYLYLRIFLDIDIFAIIRTVKNLNKYEITDIVTEPFDDADLDSTFSQFDLGGLSGIYTKSADGEYTINDDIEGLPEATSNIRLDGKQLAAFMDTVIASGLKLDGEDEEMAFSIKQVKLSDMKSLAGGPSVKMDMVIHTSIKALKSQLNVFPLTMIAKYIPEDLYISASFVVEQKGDLTYAITPDKVRLNNLSANDTSKLLSVLGTLNESQPMDMYSLSEDVGKTVMQALVCGPNGEAGFAKELAPVGINGFTFEQELGKIYFVFKK